jgi:crossover junction endodeoxyribonuclease RuvC
MQNKAVILGIDPGTQVTGYGLIASSGQHHEFIQCGTIRTKPDMKLEYRYLKIYEGVEALIADQKPHCISIETQYVQKNVRSAMMVSMVRGLVLLLAAQKNIPIFEYAPSVAKRAIVGTGSASKHQVLKMIEALLHIRDISSEDAADALALALCHAHHYKGTHV